MNVYVASSWRNGIQELVVDTLRADGHEVYDFKNPAPGDHGFGWRQIAGPPRVEWTARHFAEVVLDAPECERGFAFDMTALSRCCACVLVLPCGRSAHLELGYAVGAGKLTAVYMPEPLEEPELMYRMCDYVETTLDGVRRALSKERNPPRWQRDLVGRPASTHPRFAGLCVEYHHRECAACGQCWRHGACTCSPSLFAEEV